MNKNSTTVGIDISKLTIDFALISGEKKVHQKVDNTFSGFEKMFMVFKKLKVDKNVIIVVEATGGYHFGVVYYFLDKGFSNLKVINPRIAKAFAQMNNLRETKTDKIDASLLAELGKMKKLPSYQESKTDIEKKYIVTALMGLRKALTEQKQRYNHFRHQQDIISCTEILQAIQSIIDPLKKEINKLEKLLCQLAKDDIKIIASIPGVSEKGAAVISTLLGDISRFKNSKQVVAFSGLDPRVQESGTSIKRKGNISKKGNEVLRFSLTQSAWYIFMQAKKGQGDKIFLDFIERLQKKNMHYFQVLCAIAHKLIVVIFALLKKKEKFEKNHYFNLISV